jgi:hypothetical protein
MDDLNERDFLRAQADTLQEAWDDYHRSYLELFDVVNAMPEEDFGESHRFSWWEGQAALSASCLLHSPSPCGCVPLRELSHFR